ncbi:MAG: hypothetical protein CMK32_05930 [Porticoccaceae bacterium]|nr:hypothetical protein [Porticoccaceae bacterium]
MAVRDKGNTLDRIIRSAESEFSIKGFEGANIENIARDAGVTKQLVYHYFRTKEQLYRATLETVSEGMVIVEQAINLAENLPPREAVAGLVNAIIDDYILNPSYAALTLDQALHHGEHITASSRFIPTMRAAIDQGFRPMLEKGIKSGVFRPGLTPELTFWMIFHLATASFLNGKVISESSDIDVASEEGIDRWREATVDFVMHALAA